MGQDFRCWKIGKGIDIASQHRRRGRRRVGDELEGRFAQLNGCPPVVVITLQLHPVALHPTPKLEGPSTHRTGLVGPGSLGRHDDRIAPTHVEEEVPARAFQGDDNAVVAGGLDVVDWLEKRFLGIDAVFGPGTFQGEHDIGRLETAAVMKGHALAQLEAIALAVFRNLPALGQSRKHRAIAVDPRQAFEDVGVDDFVDGSGRPRRGIEVRWLQNRAHDDAAFCRDSWAPRKNKKCSKGRKPTPDPVHHLPVLLKA